MEYSFYKITDFIASVANGHPHIKTFQMGALGDVDTFKATMFPLCYLVPNQATINVYSSTVLNFTLLVIDRVENTNNEGEIDKYSTLQWDYRNLTNINDVWNDTLSTLNDIISFVQRNSESNAYQIYDDVDCIPFQDRFDNLLAGWGAEINLVIPNNKPACEITLN